MSSEVRASSCPVYLPRQITSPHSSCEPLSSLKSDDDNFTKEEDMDIILGNTMENGTPQEKFRLGLSFYENGDYERARDVFEKCQQTSVEARYQLAVMLFDGLGGKSDPIEAVSLIQSVFNNSGNVNHLRSCAYYNLGRAYYEGYGVRQSDDEAEKCWMQASKSEGTKGCIKAQTVLGMFYSRLGERNYDLSKAHYWHQEATGAGSLESHGALGVMYEHGLGVPLDTETAFRCFKSAAGRGNVYAMGNLAVHYYRKKLFVNAADVAKRVGSLQDTALLAKETDCLETFVRKGIALGCFIYGRCLHHGLSATKSEGEAESWYSRAAEFDLDITSKMQELTTYGYI